MGCVSVSLAELEALYRSGYASFVRVASVISGSESAGADAVQDAFAKAIKSRKTFHGDAPLEAWVWRIVVNAARTARSREYRRDNAATAEAAQNGSSTDGDHNFEVLGTVAALPERQREVVFLRYFADLDYRSIAAVLDIEVGTVSATLNAAHMTLRSAMEVPR
jgi:RNA polymerase sigma factor (sigma-70 family)